MPEQPEYVPVPEEPDDRPIPPDLSDIPPVPVDPDEAHNRIVEIMYRESKQVKAELVDYKQRVLELEDELSQLEEVYKRHPKPSKHIKVKK